jgi:DNA polymerase III delta subunit
MIFLLEGNDYLKNEFLQDFLNTKFAKVPKEVRQASIIKNPTSISQLTSVPFLSAIHKCGRVIVWDFVEFKKLEKFSPYVIPKDLDIFIIAVEKIERRLKIIQSVLLLRAEIKTFKDLYPNQVEGWILQRKKKLKLQIEPDAVKHLALLYGTNLGELTKCLEDLVKLNKNITKQDVSKTAVAVNEFSVFQLQDEMLFKRPVKSMYILKQMIKFGEQPFGLIRYFVGFFDRLYQVKTGDERVIKKLELHSFVLKKLSDLMVSQNFCLAATEILKKAEGSILMGVPAEFAVQKAILTICRLKEDNHVL